MGFKDFIKKHIDSTVEAATENKRQAVERGVEGPDYRPPTPAVSTTTPPTVEFEKRDTDRERKRRAGPPADMLRRRQGDPAGTDAGDL